MSKWASLVSIACVFFSCSMKSFHPTKVNGGFLFQYKSMKARQISVAGSFNGWSTTAHLMTKGNDGEWRAIIALRKGIHRYMYAAVLPSGQVQWIVPPDADAYIRDDFGGYNGILSVDME